MKFYVLNECVEPFHVHLLRCYSICVRVLFFDSDASYAVQAVNVVGKDGRSFCLYRTSARQTVVMQDMTEV